MQDAVLGASAALTGQLRGPAPQRRGLRQWEDPGSVVVIGVGFGIVRGVGCGWG